MQKRAHPMPASVVLLVPTRRDYRGSGEGVVVSLKEGLRVLAERLKGYEKKA